MIVGETALQQRPVFAPCDYLRPLLVSVLALASLGCKADKLQSSSDAAAESASAIGPAAALPSSMSADSVTQATAANLEQILFSQDAPTGFTQKYWAFGRRIYDGRHYAPLWTGPAATAAERRIRLSLLCRARYEGVVPALLFSEMAATKPVYGRGADTLARRDLRLTFALVEYLTTLAHGAVDPIAAGAAWNVASPPAPSDSTLAALIEAPDSAGIARLTPASRQFAPLSRALKRLLYLDLQGGWHGMVDSIQLHPGSRGPAVTRLRQRLVSSGDLPVADSLGATYSAAVTRGVRKFQQRVGLTADGRVGPATRAALDVATDVRARTVAANLERYRWIPRVPMGQAVIVDVAGGSAQVWRNGALVLSTPIRAASNCRVRIPPVIADTVAHVAYSGTAISMRLLAGGSVIIRSAALRRSASACLVADDFTALRGAIAASTLPNSPATELYLIWPTAYVAADSALMYRSDATYEDARLGAELPALTANRSTICDSVAASASASPPASASDADAANRQ